MASRSNNSERDVIEGLEQDGWVVHTRGWPDLLCVRDGVIRLIEVKPSYNRRLSTHQQALFAALSQAGIPVEVVTSRKRGVIPRAVQALRDHRPRPAEYAARRARGEITIARLKGRLHVSVPYSADFATGAVSLGGRFKKVSKLWSFRLAQWGEVQKLVAFVYPGNDVCVIGSQVDVPGGG